MLEFGAAPLGLVLKELNALLQQTIIDEFDIDIARYNVAESVFQQMAR